MTFNQNFVKEKRVLFFVRLGETTWQSCICYNCLHVGDALEMARNFNHMILLPLNSKR